MTLGSLLYWTPKTVGLPDELPQPQGDTSLQNNLPVEQSVTSASQAHAFVGHIVDESMSKGIYFHALAEIPEDVVASSLTAFQMADTSSYVGWDFEDM
jgi:hypothetical protein